MSPASRRRPRGRHREAKRSSLPHLGSRIVPAAALAVVLVGSAGAPSLPAAERYETPGLVAAGPDRSGLTGGVARASLGERTQTSASRASSRIAVPSVDTHFQGTLAPAGAAAFRTGTATSTAAVRARTASAKAEARARYVRPVQGRVTSEYGPRWGRMHNGLDFGAPHGAPLSALAAGTVTETDYSGGLGHHVTLALRDGTEVTYGHMSRIAVERGERVSAGARLGDVGNSGRSTGAHLHLEVRPRGGDPIDPRPWLQQRGLL